MGCFDIASDPPDASSSSPPSNCSRLPCPRESLSPLTSSILTNVSLSNMLLPPRPSAASQASRDSTPKAGCSKNRQLSHAALPSEKSRSGTVSIDGATPKAPGCQNFKDRFGSEANGYGIYEVRTDFLILKSEYGRGGYGLENLGQVSQVYERMAPLMSRLF
ncbi:hypothetical protein BC939DRAFT_451705, partial [Gamsiella multidivaricata]|uniref:uncharacterized protein n=1 Tax=Gamsiella multidivaricata TaxID=101098 RepID=UPI00221F7C05